MSENQLKPKPRISMIVALPTSLLLIIFFFMPWLTVSCDASELAKAAQRSNVLETPTSPMPVIPEITAEVGHASGWQLAKGDISLEAGYTQKDSRLRSDNELLKSRPSLYMGLVVPILALLLSGLVATGNASARTVGAVLLLLAIGGTVTVLWAASIDYVDDTMDKFQGEAAKSSCPGPAPPPTGVQEAKANMKKLIKTEGTVYLWASLGMYVLLAGCGIAGRTAPLAAGFQHEPASVPAAAGLRSPERERRSTTDRLPDFGPDLVFKEPARKTEDAAAPDE